MPLTLSIFLHSLSAHAECDSPTTVSDADAAMAWGEAAVSASFAGDTGERLSAGAQKADEVLDCLDQLLPKDAAARYHRLAGLAAFMEDPQRADPSFAAARRAEPGGALPSLPPGHPAQVRLSEVSTEAAATALPAPRVGRLHLDGEQGLERPDTLPVVMQYIGEDGAVQWTASLAPGEPHPAYPVRGGWPWQLTAATSGVVLSGALYGGALLLKSQYDDLAPADAAERTGMVTANHAMVIASGAIAVGSIGIGVSTAW